MLRMLLSWHQPRGRDTHYVNHLTEANVQHQDPLLNALKSVRSHAFVHLFVSCQPETAVLSSRFHCMVLILLLFLLPLATDPQWLKSKHYEPSAAFQNTLGVVSASEPQIVCIYTVVIHHKC